jgi:hypothetical protein
LAREPARWHYLLAIAIVMFAAFQLFEWYSIGQLYYRKIASGTYVSYAEHPGEFTFAAIVYVSGLAFFGGGLLYTLLGKLPRWRRRRGAETDTDSRYMARPLKTRHNRQRIVDKNNKEPP